jgi:hypothetical protein
VLGASREIYKMALGLEENSGPAEVAGVESSLSHPSRRAS